MKRQQKTLTQSKLIEIFGKKKQTPDECILKLAMEGISFTSTILVDALKTTVLDVAMSNDDYLINDATTSNLDSIKLPTAYRNSLIILGNIARIIKYTTEFNKAVKVKSVIGKLEQLKRDILDKNLSKYRYCIVSDMYEGISEIIQIIKEKEY